MSKNKIFVVYNTCGLNEVPKVKEWIKRIKPLVSQTLDGVTVCHSDNGSDDKSLNVVKEEFGKDISYFNIKTPLPVHITFNACVRECVSRFGEFEWYIHLSSGTTFEDKSDLEKIYNYVNSDSDIARVVVPAQNDNSAPIDFIVHALELKHDSKMSHHTKSHRLNQTPEMQRWDKSKKYVLKPGQRSTNHASVISNEWYKKYNGKLHPDIYNGIGVEGNYSYLATAIGKQNVIIPTDILGRYVPNDEVEGTSDRHNLRLKRKNWMFRNFRDLEKINLKNHHLGYITDLPMRYRLESKVVVNKQLVSDYEDESERFVEGLFDENGFYVEEQNQKFLYDTLSKDLFLTDEEFNYDDVERSMYE